MNNKEIKEAILTLEVLIDECKEDGTYYTAQKEWEALEVFKQLQNNWNELKKFITEEFNQNTPVARWITKEETVKTCVDVEPVGVTTKRILDKMQELENRKV